MGLLPFADADFHLYCLPLSQKGLTYAECVCMRMSNIEQIQIYIYMMLYILIRSEATLSLLMSLHLIHLANQDSLLRHKPINSISHELISSCFFYSCKWNIPFFICLPHWKGKYFGCFVCLFTNYQFWRVSSDLLKCINARNSISS